MPVVSFGSEPTAATTRIYLDGTLGEQVYHSLHKSHPHHSHPTAEYHPSSLHTHQINNRSPPQALPSKGATSIVRTQHPLVKPPPPTSQHKNLRLLVDEQKSRIEYQKEKAELLEAVAQRGGGGLWYKSAVAGAGPTATADAAMSLRTAIEGMFQGRPIGGPSK